MTDPTQVKLGWNPDTHKMMAAMPKVETYLMDAEYAQLMATIPASHAWSSAVLKTGKYLMAGNDQNGDCTMANVANDILTKSANAAHALRVPDKLVLSQYYVLTGGQDTGLYMEQVEKEYAGKGLFMSDPRYSNKLLAWATFDPTNDDLFRFCCYYFGGVSLGVGLPNTAAYQIKAGLPWDYIADPTSDQGSNEKYSWGGHSIHNPDYAVFGNTCVTWAELQPMTKAFRKHYVDFAAVRLDLNWFDKVHRTPVVGLAYKDLITDIQKYLQPALTKGTGC
jgi:hypothetical protein